MKLALQGPDFYDLNSREGADMSLCHCRPPQPEKLSSHFRELALPILRYCALQGFTSSTNSKMRNLIYEGVINGISEHMP